VPGGNRPEGDTRRPNLAASSLPYGSARKPEQFDAAGSGKVRAMSFVFGSHAAPDERSRVRLLVQALVRHEASDNSTKI
jgi:hypothetical protein